MSRFITASAIVVVGTAIVVGLAQNPDLVKEPMTMPPRDAVSRELSVRNDAPRAVVRDAVSRELTVNNRPPASVVRDVVSREISVARVDIVVPQPRDAVSRELSVRVIAPDLAPDSINASLFGSLGSDYFLTWTVRNVGGATALGPWVDQVYVSADTIPSPAEQVGGFVFSGQVAPGASYTGSATFSLPDVPGDYWIIVQIDGGNLIEEENEGNNRLLASVAAFQVDLPDLAVTSTTFPAVAFTNQTLNVAWTVSNVHEAATAFGSWVDRVYLSTNGSFDPGQDLDVSVVGISKSGPLEPGGSYLATGKIRLPNGPGTYWLCAVTDSGSAIGEVDEGNNALCQMVLIQEPDYTVANLSVSPASIFMAVRCDAADGALCPPRPAVRIQGDAVALSNPSVRVPDADVTVRLKHGSTRRVFLATADASGHFVFDFLPLALEAGSYWAVADHPAVEELNDDPRAIPFEIIGVQAQPAIASIGLTVGSSRPGQLVLSNLGDQSVGLVGLAVEPLEGPSEIGFVLGTIPPFVPPGETKIPFTVSAGSGLSNSSSLAKFKLTPQVRVNGVTINAPGQTLSVYAGPQLARIVASVNRLDADMPLCGLTLVEFDIWNEGSVPAEDVRILLPPTANCSTTDYCGKENEGCTPGPWLTSVTQESLGEIAPSGPLGEDSSKTKITLALQPGAIVPDVHDGGIAIQWVSGGQQASLTLPYLFTAVSSDTAEVVVHAEDERTYLCYDPDDPAACAGIDPDTGGGPRIAGASVVLKDSRGQVAFQTITDASGTAIIADVPLGIYLVEVSAADHGIYRATHEVVRSAETTARRLAAPNEIFAFLQSDYVTYAWTVTPTEFEDEYTITIEAVFETFVPPPKLSIEPSPTDLDLSPGEVAHIDYIITNHGFLGAQHSKIVMPQPNGYLFESLVSDLGTIPGMSSVVVPVTVTRTPGRTARVDDDSACWTSIPVEYCYWCRRWFCRNTWALVLLDNEECGGTPGGGGGLCCPAVGGGLPGPYGGGRGGGFAFDGENLCIEEDPCIGEDCESKPPKCRKGTQAKCCPEENEDKDKPKTDPVYLHSGEFYEEVEDLRIRGRGLDFVWTRRYRSRLGENTAQGNGWDFNYNISLTRDQSYLILRDGQGRRDRFRPQPNNTWARDEYFAEIERSLDGTYTLHFAEGTKWNFHPLDTRIEAGKIATIEDPAGNVLRFDYDDQGRLVTIHDTLDLDDHARDIVVTYNADGFIESVSDFSGRSVRYEYYGNGESGGSFGDLKSVAGPAVTGTPTGNDFANGKLTTYTYTKGFADEALNHNLLTITDRRRNDSNDPTFGDGPYLELFYDAAVTDPLHENYDRVVRQIWGGGTVDLVYVRQVPSPGNHYSRMKTIVNDRMGNVSEYEFNNKNRVVRERHYTGRAIPDQPTTPTQNRPRYKLRESDPNFFETLHEWNGDGVETRTIHPDGSIEEFIYEVSLNPEAPRRTRGNLRMSVRSPGQQETASDQAEIVEFFEYDDQFGCSSCNSNYVTFKQDARGFATHRDYDDEGNPIHVEHPDGGIEDFEYNHFGQMTGRVHPDNGSGHRRRDEYVYYGPDEGHQYGYLKQEIIDATGYRLTTTYEYDERGNVIRVIDPRGHDTLYAVNELDQVVRESSRAVTLANGAVVRYETDTYFDANNNVIRRDVQNIDHNGVLQSNSHLSTLYEYEQLNRLTRMSQELDESRFVVTEYDYDANRNRILTRYGEATAGRQPDNVVAFAYDERDMLFRETRGAGEADESTTQYDYDPDGNMAFVRRGIESDRPRVTEYIYDGYHRMVESKDPMGNVTAYKYDASGNRVRETVIGQLDDLEGDADSVTLSDVRYTYDSMDRLIRTQHSFFDAETGVPLAGGQGMGMAVSETDYSQDGRVIASMDDNGNQTIIDYDTANRRRLVTDAKGNTTTYQYDENSNVVSVVEVEKSDLGTPDEVFTTQTQYDELDRVVATIDNLGHTNRNQYDSRGNRARTVDALNHVIVYVYDGLDRLLRTIRDMDGDGADPASTTNGMAEPDIVTAQTWDDSSRLTSQTDDNGNPTTYAYDGLGRKVAEVYADQTEKQWLFDVHDNNVFWTDANENEVTQTYDLGNRLIRRDVIPGPGVSDDTTFEVYKYDGLSRLVWAEDDDSIVTRGYDSLSRVTSETQQYMAEAPSVVRAFYDGVGSQTLLYYPNGRVIETTYDALNRKRKIRDQGDKDGYVAEYFYIGPSRVQRRNYGNSTRMDVSYDAARRTTRTRHTVVGQTCAVDADCPSGNTCEAATGTCIIDDRTYEWNAMYNKTQVADVRPGGPLETRDYTYDAVYRLIQSVRHEPAGELERIQYVLDGVGNRMEVIGGADAGDYVMDATPGEPDDSRMNQYTVTPYDWRKHDKTGNLTAVLPIDDNQGGIGDFDLHDFASFQICFGDIPADRCESLNRSIDGLIDLDDWQQLSRRASSPLPTMFPLVYSIRNQLTLTLDVDTFEATRHLYDAVGRRIGRHGRNIDAFVVSAWQEIAKQSPGTNGMTVAFGLAVDEPICLRSASGSQFLHHDSLMTTVCVTGAAGAVSDRYEYSDFGQLLGTRTSPNELLFASHRFDSPNIGYFRMRYLDAPTGRFYTRDPLGIWFDGNALGNPYSYAGGSPTTNLDPFGLTCVRPPDGWNCVDSDGFPPPRPGLCNDIVCHHYAYGDPNTAIDPTTGLPQPPKDAIPISCGLTCPDGYEKVVTFECVGSRGGHSAYEDSDTKKWRQKCGSRPVGDNHSGGSSSAGYDSLEEAKRACGYKEIPGSRKCVCVKKADECCLWDK